MTTQLLTTKEACQYLRVSRDVLDEARQSGAISYIQHRKNGAVYFKPEFLDEFLARNTHRAAPLNLNRETYRKKRK